MERAPEHTFGQVIIYLKIDFCSHRVHLQARLVFVSTTRHIDEEGDLKRKRRRRTALTEYRFIVLRETCLLLLLPDGWDEYSPNPAEDDMTAAAITTCRLPN